MKPLKNISCLILVIILVGSATTFSSTIQSKSCLQTDVQTAINSALNNDTVLVPEGKCTWKTSKTNQTPDLSFDPTKTPSILIWKKSITLLGAGMDKTIITDSTGNTYSELPIYIKTLNNNTFHISGFNFISTKPTGTCIYILGSSKSWRIDHCDFYSKIFVEAISTYDSTYGVIDHCKFENTRVLIEEGYVIGINNPSVLSWKRPLNLGGADAVYVEDCVYCNNVYPSNAIDANAGGRYVFRYNEAYNAYCEAHSVMNGDSINPMRGTRKWEIYSNHFYSINNGTSGNYMAVSQRGGTGVIFNNTITNISGPPYNSFGYRTDYPRKDELWPGLGLCNGRDGLDGNSDSTGYPCLDQPGRSTDYSPTVRLPQTLEPIYAWNNTRDGIYKPLYVDGSPSATIIKEGRDIINSVNTPKPGYKMYTYPHPLAISDNTNKAFKPQNIRINK